MNYTQTMINLIGEINEKLPSFVEYVIEKNKGRYTIEAHIKTSSEDNRQQLIEMNIGCVEMGGNSKHGHYLNKSNKFEKNLNLCDYGIIGNARIRLRNTETIKTNISYFEDTAKNLLTASFGNTPILQKFHKKVVEDGHLNSVEEWTCINGFTFASSINYQRRS